MTDDDLEPRLRRLLDQRAGGVEPMLSGPRLRRLATGPDATRRRIRRFAPVVAAVAAVVVIAGGTALLTGGDDTPAPRPIQPGGATSTSAPAPTTSPAPPSTLPPTISPRSTGLPQPTTTVPSVPVSAQPPGRPASSSGSAPSRLPTTPTPTAYPSSR